jgi:N-acetylglucosamine-6-phosphate deacetylase
MRVTVAEGVARLAAGSDGRVGAIAGSTATTDTLFAKVVRHAAVPRAEALRRAVALTATTPARALGLTDVGAIAAGRRADLVVLDPQLRVREIYRGGVPGSANSGRA